MSQDPKSLAADNTRRRLLAAGGLAGASLALPGALRHALAQAPITVGIIYVGPRDDFGYNQAHAEAAALLKKMPGVKLVEEENVPETQAVQKSMQGMISQDGAKLLFPTSFGYFDTDGEHQLTLTGIAATLRPGGWLVLDFLNAAQVRARVDSGPGALEPGPQGSRLRRYLSPDQRYVIKEIHLADGREFSERVRLYGGSLDVGPGPRGFAVLATLPLEASR
jgi:hypothetical protein